MSGRPSDRKARGKGTGSDASWKGRRRTQRTETKQGRRESGRRSSARGSRGAGKRRVRATRRRRSPSSSESSEYSSEPSDSSDSSDDSSSGEERKKRRRKGKQAKSSDTRRIGPVKHRPRPPRPNPRDTRVKRTVLSPLAPHSLTSSTSGAGTQEAVPAETAQDAEAVEAVEVVEAAETAETAEPAEPAETPGAVLGDDQAALATEEAEARLLDPLPPPGTEEPSDPPAHGADTASLPEPSAEPSPEPSSEPTGESAAPESKAPPATVYREPDGQTVLFVCGADDMGQLGLADPDGDAEPRGSATRLLYHEGSDLLSDLDRKVGVVAGPMHSAVWTAKGQVFTWGCHDHGALGRGALDCTEAEARRPTLVRGVLLRCWIVQVACGASHTLALNADGAVFSWGAYRSAQGTLVYDEKADQVDEPREVRGIGVAVRQVACADHVDLAVTDCGQVWTWGALDDLEDTQQEAAQGTGERKETKEVWHSDPALGAEVASPLSHAPESRAGDAELAGDPELAGNTEAKDRRRLVANMVPRRVTWDPAGRATAVFAGGHTRLIVDDQGRAWLWGPNNYGQCGQPVTAHSLAPKVRRPAVLDHTKGRVVHAAMQVHHTMLVSDLGHLYALGSNRQGRLGLGLPEDVFLDKPTPVPWAEARRATDPVVQVACGEAHCLVVTRGGTAAAFGFGELGQLGLGVAKDQDKPRRLDLMDDSRPDNLDLWTVVQAAAGAQHSLFLATAQ